ncbi:hypothetical protein AZH43_00075 [Acinetobacter pragensis]|uniref:Uncharacterized protein n=1 Tax=Acinetobacter pragensis TaxID=1806892 RepID=A0A151Y697_9GAMM|nr:hypothetical protein AZH43_00075 [Acinetobacter pragensis]
MIHTVITSHKTAKFLITVFLTYYTEAHDFALIIKTEADDYHFPFSSNIKINNNISIEYTDE